MKRTALIVAAVVPLLLAACGGEPEIAGSPTAPPIETPTETPTESPTDDCPDQTGEDQGTVEMNDNFFEPRCFTMSADQTLKIENKGAALHNFTVTGTSVDIDVQSEDETNTESIGGAVAPGTYDFLCKYHPGMVGVITVA